MGEEDMKTCHLLCLDCLAVCNACVQLMAGQSDYAGKVCNICAELCQRCADECAKFDSATCQQCAEKCQTCADTCSRMAA